MRAKKSILRHQVEQSARGKKRLHHSSP